MDTNSAFTLDMLEGPDPTSFVPLYVQLANQLANLIRKQGARAVGKALPSEADCMRRFGVSRPTVRQAMAHLGSQGLITRAKGRGTFVAPLILAHDVSHEFESDMRVLGKSVEYRVLAWQKIAVPGDVAAALGRGIGDECYWLQRLRRVDEEIIGMEERYFPSAIGKQIARDDLKSQPALAIIRRVTQQKPVRLDMEVSAIAASRQLAVLLEVKAGVPLLLRKGTFFGEQGRSLMHGTATFLASYYKFKLSLNFSA